MKIKILHLYHDIMNLYGEYANISALTRMLEKNNIPYELDRLTIGDTLSLEDYDFIYMGSGTESNARLVTEHLRTYAEDLKACIEAGKVLLLTGNALELLGKEITDAKEQKHSGLGLFDFTVTEQERTRTTADAIFTMEGEDRPLVGFVNKCSTITGITSPLFEVKMGLGNEKDGKTEGIRYKNLFGTHLTGPLLIKNPYFLIYLTKLLLQNSGDAIKVEEVTEEHLKYEKQGYEVTLRELLKRCSE